MTTALPAMPWRERYPWFGYVAPFAAIILLIYLVDSASAPWRWTLEVILLMAIIFVTWPRELDWKPARPWTAVLIGGLVFALWIGPDLLSSTYRQGFLFSNSLFGHVVLPAKPGQFTTPWILFWRTLRAVTVVPIAEELFWRGWLMRWLIKPDFQRVSLGAYSPFAFWISAILFGLEHGPYWDVGLLTGVIYNWWMVRSKSVASCIVMHSVTNLLLSLYVIYGHQWQYWQ